MSEKKDRFNVTATSVAAVDGYDMRVVMLPMRDGVKLQTVIGFPPNFSGKGAVLLIRSPYTRRTELVYPYAGALKRGVVAILQACRGTGWSEGLFDPADREYEKNDAADTFAWLEKQSWYNGRSVMLGASYPGWVQWCAMKTGYPGLVGTAPHVAPVYGCCGAARPGGVVRISFAQSWMLSMHHRCRFGYENVPDFEKEGLFEKLPVIEADRNAGYPEDGPYRRFLSFALKPAELADGWRRDFRDFTAPAYISGGWFDGFKEETISSFIAMKNGAASSEAAAFTRLVVGPWIHGGLANPDLFGKKCDYRKLDPTREKFLFNLLRRPHRDPLPGEPAVRYYMLCENKWHSAETWPPAGTAEKRFFLHGNGAANTLNGDGRLSETPPGKEPCDVYVSDPRAPVLSDGGKHAALGCYDRRPMQSRSDVLVYTGEKFTSPLTVTGEVKLRFFASVSTPDTDFFATLSCVMPDGRAMFLVTGGLRARFRDPEKEVLLEPGKIYEFRLSLGNTAVKFMPGCALRLELCGQHFPAFERNANSGGPLLRDRELHLSRHTIYHDKDHPAELLLPVLPPEPLSFSKGSVPRMGR